ncbi:hypothetical protein [Methanoplanus endosymbiosus]|uniref:GOLD domain-containing protein n=1 Tax=Methanoplanus endosymbiosus TaxID=33865 RepID=A0A9E7TKI7_9EURY|nr:hypothetical protein [Methanoplanus endosymbiosus]UUX92670.1 hypothetical protein L6E24_00650 [Methanoplanus endosymbiosus]
MKFDWGLIFILVVSTLICGCLSDKLNFSNDMEEPIDEVITLDEEYIQSYSLTGIKGAVFDIQIVTDGAPVDLWIFDDENYINYDKSFEDGLNYKWKGISHKIINNKKISYKLPDTGTYYLVIENAYFTEEGANAGRKVNLRVIIN